MRLPSKRQSFLRAPLNAALGSEANVRILRVLALTRPPITAGELATRAGLNRTSVYPALDALEQIGIVMLTGTGAQRQIRLRSVHPLASALRALFRAERRRFDDFLASLRDIVRTLEPSPTAVWIEGPVLSDEDRPGDPLVCYVLANPAELPTLIDHLSDRVVALERTADITLDIRGTTKSELVARADADETRLADAILLAGVPPTALRPGAAADATKAIRSHEDHDARAHALARLVAEKIKRDPGVIDVARAQIRRREERASPQERRELREWLRVFATMSPRRLQQFLTEPSERAARLRQSLPALGVVSPAEVRTALAALSKRTTAAK